MISRPRSSFFVLGLLATATACVGPSVAQPGSPAAQSGGSLAESGGAESAVGESGSALAESVWAGIYSQQQAERGAAHYLETCSSCHSEDLRGNSNAPSLIGSSFMFLWGDRSLGDLFTSIQTLMPTNAPNSLPTRSYLDILAFIMESNGFPPGTSELVADPAFLGRIMITARSGL